MRGMLLKGDTLPRGNGTVQFHLDASNKSFLSYVSSDTVNAVILLAGFKGQHEPSFTGAKPYPERKRVMGASDDGTHI
jgi:hypothetical protein